MEKAVVFGPIIIFFAFFALLVLGFFALIFKIIRKSKNEDWKGEIIDKKHTQYEDMDDNRPRDNYFLVVKMEGGGRNRNVGLSKALWDDFAIGDRLHKPKGKLFPVKI